MIKDVKIDDDIPDIIKEIAQVGEKITGNNIDIHIKECSSTKDILDALLHKTIELNIIYDKITIKHYLVGIFLDKRNSNFFNYSELYFSIVDNNELIDLKNKIIKYNKTNNAINLYEN